MLETIILRSRYCLRSEVRSNSVSTQTDACNTCSTCLSSDSVLFALHNSDYLPCSVLIKVCVYRVRVQCCFTSTETIRTIRDVYLHFHTAHELLECLPEHASTGLRHPYSTTTAAPAIIDCTTGSENCNYQLKHRFSLQNISI